MNRSQVRPPGVVVPVTGPGRPGGTNGDRTGPGFFEGGPTGHRTGPGFFEGGPTGHRTGPVFWGGEKLGQTGPGDRGNRTCRYDIIIMCSFQNPFLIFDPCPKIVTCK